MSGSDGGGEKERGGSPGMGPTPVEFKDAGRDGATLCIINQQQSRKNAAARPFPDRADGVYAGLEGRGGGVK